MELPTHAVTLSSALRRLLCDYQTICSVDCCQARAFQLSEDAIGRWLALERTDRMREIAAEIERIEADARGVEGRVLLSASGLESEWNAGEFRAFWEQFRAAYAAAAAHRREITFDPKSQH